jgi:hypothetical protein
MVPPAGPDRDAEASVSETTRMVGRSYGLGGISPAWKILLPRRLQKFRLG